jgi:enoyl-CoA hydratase/carnithine racemase
MEPAPGPAHAGRMADSPLALLAGPDGHGVAVITLNRPDKKNALSIALRDEVTGLLRQLAGDQRVKAVIITGRGGCFSAGFDLAEFTVSEPAHQQRLWDSSDRFHHAVHRFPLPIIAAVDGIAYGGGFDLAVLADLRVATHRARFAHPESHLGPVVYAPLHDLVGGAIARDLVLTGRPIDAAEALRLHLITHITEPADLQSQAFALAHQITQAPRDVLIHNKKKFIARSAIDPATPTLDL